jgi:predicted metal-dependent HD superfamily phosphohydrolase
MSGINEEMIARAKDYVLNLLDNKLPEGFSYHNSWHTLDVLKHAEQIGYDQELSEADLNKLRLAALFHDVGYIDTYSGHEAQSAVYATEYLQTIGIDRTAIQEIAATINATKVPQKPADRVAKILCDADLFYLSDPDDYFRQADLLRKEWKNRQNLELDEQAFCMRSLEFFGSHTYHTDYGRKVLQPGKEKVEKMIKDKLSSIPPANPGQQLN